MTDDAVASHITKETSYRLTQVQGYEEYDLKTPVIAGSRTGVVCWLLSVAEGGSTTSEGASSSSCFPSRCVTVAMLCVLRLYVPAAPHDNLAPGVGGGSLQRNGGLCGEL